MARPLMFLAPGVLASAAIGVGDSSLASDYRTRCLELMKVQSAAPPAEGDARFGDCVRDDITTGQIDMQSMGFAVMSDEPGRNVQRLIEAGFPAGTGQGVIVIGTLNRLFTDGKLSGAAYLGASEPLIRAGALDLVGDGPLDVLSELLRNSPEPETVCGFAAIVGGFDVFEDRSLPRALAATNPDFDAADHDVLADCGL